MASSYARAILQHQSNSHPFEERYLEFREPIKVGRAVARCKPLRDNAIFDCKVLSRNHALLSFDNGKFLLMDTRSSNGTFVNYHRLSPANEDSAPEELFSGDIIQFGVEVMESAKKMTHGCIVLSIKLYYPNGEEAIRPSNHISNNMTMLFEPSTFMQQHGPLLQDQTSMLPFMFSDHTDMFMSQTSNNNCNSTSSNNSNTSTNHISNGSSTLTSSDTGSLTTIDSTTNKTYVPNNSASSFKNVRQTKSIMNNSNNGKQSSTDTMQSRTANDGTATIQRKPVYSPYSNSMSYFFDRVISSQGGNNNINQQQQSFCPSTTSNSDQSNSGNSSVNIISAVSSYYCETVNFFNLLKEASQREQQLRQRLQQVEKSLEEAHLAADKGWRACIEEDLLLSKIETLQKKLEFLMRANKVAKLKDALKEDETNAHQEVTGGDSRGITSSNNHINDETEKDTKKETTISSEQEFINNLEQQLQEKVLNYIDDKARFELIAKEATKKALQKEYLAFQQIHDLENLLKASEAECRKLQESNERLEQLNTSREAVNQQKSEEMTQERLILMKDIDNLKQANSQLHKQYGNLILESAKKVEGLEHKLRLASQQICDMQLKDKQLANLRFQLNVVNQLYQQANENNQHLKNEFDVQATQLLERINIMSLENTYLKSELETHRIHEKNLSNHEKDANFCVIIPPIILLLTVLIAYLIGAP